MVYLWLIYWVSEMTMQKWIMHDTRQVSELPSRVPISRSLPLLAPKPGVESDFTNNSQVIQIGNINNVTNKMSTVFLFILFFIIRVLLCRCHEALLFLDSIRQLSFLLHFYQPFPQPSLQFPSLPGNKICELQFKNWKKFPSLPGNNIFELKFKNWKNYYLKKGKSK